MVDKNETSNVKVDKVGSEQPSEQRAHTTADGDTSPTRLVECNVGGTAGPAPRDAGTSERV